MPEIVEQESRDFVNSLARGLEVIRSFTRNKPAMTLSEVAERTDMNRAAARRFLLTLVREGYAETNGKYFRLRPKVLELGFSVLASMDLTEVLRPVMDELAEKLEESCFAAVLDRDSVIYIARAESRRFVNVGISIGSRAPAHAMSSGRVLLAALPDAEFEAYLEALKVEKLTPNTMTSKVKLRAAIDEARRQGWAIVDQEYEIGLRSMSVPIKDRAGTTVAALNITCPTPRVTLDDMRVRFLPELQAGAQRIAMGLP
ncbi:IclR family transcriptional regulator domain-containing protein [Microvirga antarctica]|uniref:IclR family transcriptional regulator domain-containing protein n=1 Tax=Microvirga antarctica TaxID=2819233 RepID=UPI001B30CC0A|nr:IclR family transcriptional regulator C-terminal domain-containing protein [Microvirga antarctica]